MSPLISWGIKGKSQIMVSSNKVEADIPVWAIPFKGTHPPLDDFSVSQNFGFTLMPSYVKADYELALVQISFPHSLCVIIIFHKLFGKKSKM